jgi:hypothetical protein
MLMTILALVVSATIDNTTLPIGDQTNLTLQATSSASEQVTFPEFGNELISGIEIVDISNVQSKKLDNGRVQYSQNLTITSFEDSLFNIDPLPIVSGGDTTWTEALTLNVIQPFDMDSTITIIDIDTIRDIPFKTFEQQEFPTWWDDQWENLKKGKNIYLIVLIVCVLGLIGWLIYRYTRRRKQERPKVVILRPADVVALEQLDFISSKKLWQAGRVKEYYTQLTDVVREYIARRFGVSSTEQTSNATLAEMRPLLKNNQGLYQQLHDMLTLADLVKFAKWQPTDEENGQVLRDAYDFVKETTIKEDPKKSNK